MNLITMVPATARFIAQMRGMRRHIVENNVTEFAVFQNWCDENNERWAEALDSGCAIAIEKFIADWNGRADANRILVTSLLQSVPGIGASKAVVIMRLYRIPKGRRVGGLGIRQREALVALERNGWKL